MSDNVILRDGVGIPVENFRISTKGLGEKSRSSHGWQKYESGGFHVMRVVGGEGGDMMRV